MLNKDKRLHLGTAFLDDDYNFFRYTDVTDIMGTECSDNTFKLEYKLLTLTYRHTHQTIRIHVQIFVNICKTIEFQWNYFLPEELKSVCN